MKKQIIFPLLCHFDHQTGPLIFLKSPELNNLMYLDHIPALMDLYTEGIFIHEYVGIRSINQIFEINNPLTRGKAEILMFSLICFEEYYDLNSFQEILQFFVDHFRAIPDAYKAFHFKLKNLDKEKEKFNEIALFFYSFYYSLPKKETSFIHNTNKSLIYGLSPLGKEKILETLQKNLIQTNNSSDFQFISK